MKTIEFEVLLDKFGHERLRVRIRTEKGELRDVVYQYESFLHDRWVVIVRYDCAHGYFHRDVMLPNGDKQKNEVILDSLKTASKYAEHDIKNHWEWYKENYLRKLKKK